MVFPRISSVVSQRREASVVLLSRSVHLCKVPFARRPDLLLPNAQTPDIIPLLQVSKLFESRIFSPDCPSLPQQIRQPPSYAQGCRFGLRGQDARQWTVARGSRPLAPRSSIHPWLQQLRRVGTRGQDGKDARNRLRFPRRSRNEAPASRRVGENRTPRAQEGDPCC